MHIEQCLLCCVLKTSQHWRVLGTYLWLSSDRNNIFTAGNAEDDAHWNEEWKKVNFRTFVREVITFWNDDLQIHINPPSLPLYYLMTICHCLHTQDQWAWIWDRETAKPSGDTKEKAEETKWKKDQTWGKCIVWFRIDNSLFFIQSSISSVFELLITLCQP